MEDTSNLSQEDYNARIENLENPTSPPNPEFDEWKDKKNSNNKISWYLIIAGVFVLGFLYFTYSGLYKGECKPSTNLTAVCEGYSFNFTCPACPDCNPTLNCDVPDEIKVKLNST